LLAALRIKYVASLNPAFLIARVAIETKLDFCCQAALKKTVYATSTILDPRFKQSYFKGRRDSTSLKKEFLEDAEPYSKFSEKIWRTNKQFLQIQRGSIACLIKINNRR
jgi:hypothetical protein